MSETARRWFEERWRVIVANMPRAMREALLADRRREEREPMARRAAAGK